jgi:hypothetical protein
MFGFSSLPWTIETRPDGCTRIVANDGKTSVTYYNTMTPADQLYTVQAVNAHEALAAYVLADEKANELHKAALAQDGEEYYQVREECEKRYWEALERLFPEIAAKCPIPSMEERIEWFGQKEAEKLTDHEARHLIYGWDRGDYEDSADYQVHELVEGLRATALAALRGEAPPQVVVVTDESLPEGTVVLKGDRDSVTLTNLGTGD